MSGVSVLGRARACATRARARLCAPRRSERRLRGVQGGEAPLARRRRSEINGGPLKGAPLHTFCLVHSVLGDTVTVRDSLPPVRLLLNLLESRIAFLVCRVSVLIPLVSFEL